MRTLSLIVSLVILLLPMQSFAACPTDGYISCLTAENVPQSADLLELEDVSASTSNKITLGSVGSGIRAVGTTVLTGTIDPTASAAVVGVGTLFTTELRVGDRITVTGETRTVTVITDATNLTVNAAFTDQANDTSPDRLPAPIRWETSGGALLGYGQLDGGVYLLEHADAGDDVATFGQLWVNTATPNELYFTDDAGTDFQIGGSGAAVNIVNDLTPQLGGQLDVNGNCLGDGTLEIFCFTETGSAINEITLANAAAGNSPTVTATGDDTDIGFNFTSKGEGAFVYLFNKTTPTANATIFQVGTGDDAARMTLDEDGDMTIDGDVALANSGCVNIQDLGGASIGVLCLDASDDLNIGDATGVDNINFDTVGATTFGNGGTDRLVISAAGEFAFTMATDEDIVITGTNRAIDTGTMRFEQSPAIENTRAITINVDANSQATTHAMVVNFEATALAAGEVGVGYDVTLDKSTSTGGVIHGFECSEAGAGSANVQCVHVGVGADVIHHESGVFGNLEQAHTESGGLFVDITAATASTSTDATMFAADDDALYLGDAATFGELEFNLATVASGGGISPTFEFSDGVGGWTVFTPSDDTIGMRQTGNIMWTIGDLSGWATDPTPPALGSVTLDSGASGSVDGITVNSVEVMSGAENFDTSLTVTAAAVAANIVAHTSSPNYTAYSTGAVVTIQAIATGAGVNGFVVTSSTTTIATTDANMAGGTADKFQVRITRTRNSLSTAPVEDTIQIAAAAEFTWDSAGVITASTIEPTGDTSAADNAAIGYTAVEGLILTGQGSTNDVTIKNDADTNVINILTGTDDVTLADNLSLSSAGAQIGVTAIVGAAGLTLSDATSPFMVLNDSGGSNGAIAQLTNDLYFSSSSGTGALVFKNNHTSTGNPSSSGDEKFRIGDAGITIAGTITAAGLGTTTGTNLLLSASNVVSKDSSSRIYKEHIIPTMMDTSVIFDMIPVDFNFIGDDKTVVGWIAEDVFETAAGLANLNSDGNPESWDIRQALVMTVAELKKVRAELNALQSEDRQ